jgi:hypothetical protein
VCAVRRAAESLERDRFLLPADANRLTAAASSARILAPAADSTVEARAIAEALCR